MRTWLRTAEILGWLSGVALSLSERFENASRRAVRNAQRRLGESK